MERKFKEFDVVLSKNVENIPNGTKGVVVHKYKNNWYDVEFFSNNKTIGVELVEETQIVFKR